MSTLKAYMGWSGDDSREGACLIFASTAREAKQIGYPTVAGWDADCEFTDMRVRRLRKPHIMDLADRVKLVLGVPHVIDNPPVCKRCEQWGEPIVEGVCWPCTLEERPLPMCRWTSGTR